MKDRFLATEELAKLEAEDLAAALPADGHTKILRIDHAGAVVEAL